MADSLHGVYRAFVADRDPGWDRYDLDRRPTGLVEHGVTVATDPDADERLLWEGVR